MSIHVRHSKRAINRGPLLASAVGVLLAICAHCLHEHRFCHPLQRKRQGPIYSLLAEKPKKEPIEERTEKIEVAEPFERMPEADFLIDTAPQALRFTEPESFVDSTTCEETAFSYPQFTPTDAELAEVDTPKTTTKIKEVQHEYIPPQYKSTPHPPYPARLRRNRIEGNVRVRITVSATGYPTLVEILSSSHPDFAQPTKEKILKDWVFSPAMTNGLPVAAVITTTVYFQM